MTRVTMSMAFKKTTNQESHQEFMTAYNFAQNEVNQASFLIDKQELGKDYAERNFMDLKLLD